MSIEVVQIRNLDQAGLERIARDLPLISDEEFSASKIKAKTPKVTEATQFLPNSTVHQIRSFGIEVWRKSYEFLRSAQRLGKFLTEGEKSLLWKTICPRMARFQELFSDPHQRVIPIPFTNQRPSLKGCIVNPALIPDKFAQALGLIKLKDFKGKPREKLMEKASSRVVNTLKATFQYAMRINPDNSRIFVIEQLPERLLIAINPSYITPRKLPGSIICTSQKSSASATSARAPSGRLLAHKKCLKAQLYSSAYAAVRKTKHVEHGYALEVEKIGELQADLKIFISRLDRGWRKDSTRQEKDDLLLDWAALQTKCLEVLYKKVDRHKLDAFTALNIGETFTDSRGRENVSVAMSKMVKAVDRVTRRLACTKFISGYNTEDQMMLRAELKSQETALLSFSRTISGKNPLFKHMALLNPKTPMGEKLLDTNVRGFMRSLRAHPSELENVRMRPLRQVAKLLTVKYNELELSAKGRDLTGVERAFSEIQRISEFAEELIAAERKKIEAVRPK